MKILIHQNVLVAGIIAIAVAGIIIKLISWTSYRHLEKASANMNENKNVFTRRIKLKFENCYKLNLDIKNIPAFVEKYMRSYKQFGITLAAIQKILQIAAVLIGMLALGGTFLQYINNVELVGMVKTIMTGIFAELFLLLFELLFDTREMPQRIKSNLEEYLENVYSNRLQLEYDDSASNPVVSEEELYQRGVVHTAASKVKIKKSRKPVETVSEEESVIREIIKEFLC